jgi:hypothetical protein
MGAKKSSRSTRVTPSAARFHVVKLRNGRFGILDAQIPRWQLPSPGVSQSEAEAERKRLNAPNPTFHRRFNTVGITAEDILGLGFDEELGQEYERGVPDRAALTFATAVPPTLRKSLRTWGAEVAKQCAFGDKRFTYKVVKALLRDPFSFKFDDPALRDLLWDVWPVGLSADSQSGEELEFRRIICVHFVATDPDNIKAGSLGYSERSYQRRLDAALKWLATQK